MNQKECGLLFKAKFIDKSIQSEPSDAMKLGIYFEYLCTGMLPKSGEVPKPELTQKGQLTAPYKKVEESAQLFKLILSYYKIKILKVGYYLETDDSNGLIDIWAEWNGRKCIIDLKYSGLLDDKWNELGWNEESLHMKDSIMIQGVHYKLLVKKKLNLDADFYYFVFSSADSTDMKIIRQVVDEEKFAAHEVAISNTKIMLEKELKRGFKAFPDYRRCKKCPLYESCDKRAIMPLITDIHY
jgi:hypothetical protein